MKCTYKKQIYCTLPPPLFQIKINNYKRMKIVILIFFCGLFLGKRSNAQQITGLPTPIISEKKIAENDFPLTDANGDPAILSYDKSEYKGVIRAIDDLQTDIYKVTGVKPIIDSVNSYSRVKVVIGTLGKSKIIDQLISDQTINISDLKGKWESFVIQTISNPVNNEKQLIIAGSDKRGTIYGIYELSQQLGVSPWYWWADVPVKKRPEAYVKAGRYFSGEPKVKYRGIFINDENPCMQTWARAKFGGMNREMYTHLFELLLRLRANFLWPGMWGTFKEHTPDVPVFIDKNGNYEGNSFNEDDPDNPRLADEYGIVMGTSHHEPMQRSQQEWIRNKTKYGNGEWNYLTNKEGIQKFFKEGIEHTKDYESLITMGMRGDEDEPMVDAGSAEANFRVLEGIMKDQREIIEEVTGKPAAETPQIWTLYKEVLEYYDQGMVVPDDIIILLCDDNWGDVRRLPELNGEKHPGGYGMYYHAGYYGAPRASKWLNVTQLSQMWEQLNLTYDYGVDKVWILNVGDLKPNEYPMDFFLNMAWNPKSFNENNLVDYARKFCGVQFGEKQAQEAAEIIETYCKYASRITPEMLNDKTYNLQSGEFKMVKNEFLALEARALRQFLSLPENYQDAYTQLVLFPVQALANLYDMYYSLAMNKKLANEQDILANYWADRVDYCFDRDSVLCYNYNHNMANGKWNHMMDQPHIGYTTWHGPEHNIRPEVKRINPDKIKQGGYVFSENNGVVVMEAEHYFQTKSLPSTKWTIIPGMGRTLSGIALMPYTKQTSSASISYKMKLKPKSDSISVRIYFDSTMPFKRGGHKVSASFDGGAVKTWNINQDFIWKNCYTKMYPTGAARLNESVVTLSLPKASEENYTLTLKPLDPGIIIYKIIVDDGGYQNTYLKMKESDYEKM